MTANDLKETSVQQQLALLDVAVLIPCFNEAAVIGQVIADFQQALPSATIYVFDNNSTDETSSIADVAGAVVREEPMQGKGNVVRRMFSDVVADVFVLVDGDATYDAKMAPTLIERLVTHNLDMVNASRVSAQKNAYRPGHRTGNQLLTKLVGAVFGHRIQDMLSGYRVFSSRFVKSFPAISTGFEVETELTIHALDLNMPIDELPTAYSERVVGSESKLRTYRDGFRILTTISRLVKEERPFQLFSIVAALLSLLSIVLAWPIVIEYMETGLVPRFPTAILSSAIMLLAFQSFFAGLILETVTRGRKETKRMWYLSLPSIANILSSKRSLTEAGRQD